LASTPIAGIPTVWIIAPTTMIEDNAFVTAIMVYVTQALRPKRRSNLRRWQGRKL
jgi:hypothetical protein